MLALTTDAAAAIEAIVRAPEVPAGAVLRITLKAPLKRFSHAEIEVFVADEPGPDDVEIDGLPVAVEPRAYDVIGEKVLDAQLVGGGSGFEFRLYERPEEFALEGILNDPAAPPLPLSPVASPPV